VSEGDATRLLDFHRFLLAETDVRLDRFRQAIAERVKPGDTVLDLGTGTGILAFLACRAGARRVYAVDNAAVIEWARLMARANGFEDRIVFLGRPSQDIELPEHVDLVVADIFGLCGLYEGGIRSLMDVRDRFLKPGGVMIPKAFEMFVAPVEVPAHYRRHIDCWNSRRHGFDWSAMRQLAVNNRYPVLVKPRALLAEAAVVAAVDVAGVTAAALSGEVCLTVRRTGTMHGLCGWFTSALSDEVALTNRPGATTTNYAQAFFPVERPIPLSPGDRVTARVTSYDNLDWRWQIVVERPHQGSVERIARFDHSTFLGFPLSAASIREAASLASGRPADRAPLPHRRTPRTRPARDSVSSESRSHAPRRR
jgi:SAM-dependent methyltransferase